MFPQHAGGVTRLLPEFPGDARHALLEMTNVAYNGSPQTAAAAVHTILDMGPYPLSAILQRGLDFRAGGMPAWRAGLEHSTQGLAALLDAAAKKVRPARHTTRAS